MSENEVKLKKSRTEQKEQRGGQDCEMRESGKIGRGKKGETNRKSKKGERKKERRYRVAALEAGY